MIGRKERVVGHVPRTFVHCLLEYGIQQGGLKIPTKLTFTATSKEEGTNAKKLIEGTLNVLM